MQVIFSLSQEQVARAQQQIIHTEEFFGDNGLTLEENAANGVLYHGTLMGFHQSTHECTYLTFDREACTMTYEGPEEYYPSFQDTINLILG